MRPLGRFWGTGGPHPSIIPEASSGIQIGCNGSWVSFDEVGEPSGFDSTPKSHRLQSGSFLLRRYWDSRQLTQARVWGTGGIGELTPCQDHRQRHSEPQLSDRLKGFRHVFCASPFTPLHSPFNSVGSLKPLH